MTNNLFNGKNAEQQALHYLVAHGLKHLDSNYYCKGGEIDLIMNDAEQLVFVEVRYRSRSDYGSAAESVTVAKQRKLIIAAQHYLMTSGLDKPCRFDVVGIDNKRKINWIKDAFQV